MTKLRLKKDQTPSREKAIAIENSSPEWIEQRLSEAQTFVLCAETFAPYLQRCVRRLAPSYSDLSPEQLEQRVAAALVHKLRDRAFSYDAASYHTALATNATSHKPAMANLANFAADLEMSLHTLSVHESAILDGILANGQHFGGRSNLDSISNAVASLHFAARRAFDIPVKKGTRRDADVQYFVSRIFFSCGAISSRSWAKSNLFVDDDSSKGFVNPNAQLVYMILRTFRRDINVSAVRTAINSLTKGVE